MKVFIRRVIVGFAIGLSLGSAFAAAPNRKPANNSFKEAKALTSREAVLGDELFAETETFLVHSENIPNVLRAMATLSMAEDIDFAWLNRSPNARIVSFVCYSSDCYQWAKKKLHTIATAPARPEEAIGQQWHDAAIDSMKARELSDDEKIKARQALRYSNNKEG